MVKQGGRDERQDDNHEAGERQTKTGRGRGSMGYRQRDNRASKVRRGREVGGQGKHLVPYK